MKQIIILTFFILISLTEVKATSSITHLPTASAQTSWTADNGNGTFTNPLFYDEFSGIWLTGKISAIALTVSTLTMMPSH